MSTSDSSHQALSKEKRTTLILYTVLCLRQIHRIQAAYASGSQPERRLRKQRVELHRWISSVSSTLLAVLSSCSTGETHRERRLRKQRVELQRWISSVSSTLLAVLSSCVASDRERPIARGLSICVYTALCLRQIHRIQH